MAKSKGNRVQVILECTEHKDSGQPGTSRYITTKNRKKHSGSNGNQKVQCDPKEIYSS
jgi:ribosomal protein L33